MELVDSEKLMAVCKFIAENEIDGKILCHLFNKSLPEELKIHHHNCDEDFVDCRDCCSLFNKNLLYQWFTKNKYNVPNVGLKRPDRRDYYNFLKTNKKPFNKDKYLNDLEKYCNQLEGMMAGYSCDLDNAESENRNLTSRLDRIKELLYED